MNISYVCNLYWANTIGIAMNHICVFVAFFLLPFLRPIIFIYGELKIKLNSITQPTSESVKTRKTVFLRSPVKTAFFLLL